MSELGYLSSLWSYYLLRLRELRDDETGGSTIETAILTAILAALALAVGAIIVSKVTAKAQSIPTD